MNSSLVLKNMQPLNRRVKKVGSLSAEVGSSLSHDRENGKEGKEAKDYQRNEEVIVMKGRRWQ
jgi:hypothetical protein